MRRPIVFLLCFLAFPIGAATRSARADLVISIGDASIVAGGTGSVDVLISGTPGQTLSLAAYQFLITPISPTTSQLAFSNPQSDSVLTNPNYVFAGHSADQTLGLAIGNVTTTTTPNDTFTGGDSYTPPGGFATFLTPTPIPLESLDFNATGGGLLPGDSFLVTLVNNPDFTGFADGTGTPVNFTSTPGTVTIIKAVPEPASMAILGSGFLLLGGFRRLASRRRRETVPTQDAHAA